MDFARIDTLKDAEAGATLHLSDPYDNELLFRDGKAIEIDVLGLESDAGRRAAARMVKALNKRTGQKKTVKNMSVDEIIEAGAENEEVQATFYAEITTGWRNITYIEDADIDDESKPVFDLEFTRENAVKLYKTRAWIRAKVDAFLGEKANFKRKLSKG